MTARKRKQPEPKRVRRNPGIALRGLALGGALLSHNPSVAGGAIVFAVVFSFVAANAMWYQTSVHPSPLMRTRIPLLQPQAQDGGTGNEGGTLEPRLVTTFVIKREDETASVPHADLADGAPDPKLTADIQKELSRLGLYDGTADGRSGPRTVTAIERFEKLSGRAVTGTVDEALLTALLETPDQPAKRPAEAKAKPTLASAKPAQRPYGSAETGKGELDPVAAAIRNAEIDPQYIPKADIPASSTLVMNIQKGLANLAYADVSIDGVASDETRSAIRHFEKHYRLPETGQPSDKILKKMREIGAL